jgi:hypothetical protein
MPPAAAEAARAETSDTCSADVCATVSTNVRTPTMPTAAATSGGHIG